MRNKRENLCLLSVKSFFVLILLFSLFGISSFAQQSSRKEQIREAETLLKNLGYWVLNVDGIADDSTKHALTAFQKIEKRPRTGSLNEKELIALRIASRPIPKFTGESHIEVDLTRQVVFLVDENGFVSHILPVSTGTEKKYFDQGKWQVAHTPRGDFKITRQIKGVRHAPLGNLYNPNYFYLGVAIHGSNSIPTTPASHGCVRIPRFADKGFQELVSIGMTVNVYD